MTMTLATPNPADQQRNRAEAEHQAAKGAGGRRSRDEHIGRPTDLDGVRLSGVGGRGQHPLHRGRLAWVGAQVNPGVTAGVAEHRGADREAHDTELSISGASGTGRRIRLPGDEPQRDTVLEHGELITAVDLPALQAAARSRYRKVRTARRMRSRWSRWQWLPGSSGARSAMRG